MSKKYILALSAVRGTFRRSSERTNSVYAAADFWATPGAMRENRAIRHSDRLEWLRERSPDSVNCREEALSRRNLWATHRPRSASPKVLMANHTIHPQSGRCAKLDSVRNTSFFISSTAMHWCSFTHFLISAMDWLDFVSFILRSMIGTAGQIPVLTKELRGEGLELKVPSACHWVLR